MRDRESGHIPRSAERQEETRQQGRDILYEELYRLLPVKQREAFKLINVSLADLDDLVDQTDKPDFLIDAVGLLEKVYQGEQVPTVEEWQKDIQHLGEVLRELKEGGFDAAERIYQETINFWEADRKDKDRKGAIVNQSALDRSNTDIGRAVVAQFLIFFCPGLRSDELERLSQSYGLAVKTADNLSDLEKDLKTGFVNVSKENMHRYVLTIEGQEGTFAIRGDLNPYKTAELQRAEQLFEEAQRVYEEIEKNHLEYKTQLSLLRDVFTSWLREAETVSTPLGGPDGV